MQHLIQSAKTTTIYLIPSFNLKVSKNDFLNRVCDNPITQTQNHIFLERGYYLCNTYKYLPTTLFSLCYSFETSYICLRWSYTRPTQMKLYLTHSLESCCKREKKMVESLSMFVFFRDQKDFYGVTLNGCSGEGSDMVN